MKKNHQDWDEFWQQFKNDDHEHTSLDLFDDSNSSDLDQSFLSKFIFASYSVEFSNVDQKKCYAFSSLFSTSSFLNIETALKSDSISCEKILIEKDVNEISLNTLRFVVRQMHKTQMK